MIVDALRNTPLLNLLIHRKVGSQGFASSLDFRLGVEIPDSSRESRLEYYFFIGKERKRQKKKEKKSF